MPPFYLRLPTLAAAATVLGGSIFRFDSSPNAFVLSAAGCVVWAGVGFAVGYLRGTSKEG